MNIGITSDRASNNYSAKGSPLLQADNQKNEKFADYFQKSNVKHLEGAKNVKASGGNEAKNAYFQGAKDGLVEYNGVIFRCNYKTGALELGDCSHPYQCIRVPLEKGGSLLFNPDSISGINQAIGMFSAEDQGRIMRAIQLYNMAKDKMEELEEDENADPEEATSKTSRDDSSDYRNRQRYVLRDVSR